MNQDERDKPELNLITLLTVFRVVCWPYLIIH
jgi:hypothetical protein